MTKAQIQELLGQRDEEISLYKKMTKAQLQELRVQDNEILTLFKKINKCKEEIENIGGYEQWKERNGEFLKRYISELFQSYQLSFDFESEYNGYFDMNVSMDGEKLSEYSGQISMGYNGLEE